MLDPKRRQMLNPSLFLRLLLNEVSSFLFKSRIVRLLNVLCALYALCSLVEAVPEAVFEAVIEADFKV